MPFYGTSQVNTLEQEQVLKDVEMFIQKFEFIGAGVASISVDDVTLTPATSPAFTVNALASTVANNIITAADTSILAEGKIDSNAATDVVFDATNMVNVADGTALAATDWTSTTSYNFYALTASSDNEFGDFFGWTNEAVINVEEEKAEFKVGVPRALKNEGLLERVISVTGNHANLSNTDVVTALFNMTSRGSQTAQTELHTGFDPAQRSFYRITLVGENINAQEMVYQFFKTKIRTEGGLNLGEEGFKVSGFNLQVHSDTLRTGAFDAFRYRLKD